MAIKWTDRGAGSTKRAWTSHEGLVVGPIMTREIRVMSDVYADAVTVRVWNPDLGRTEVIDLGVHFELCDKFGSATVDAPAEILAEVARQDAETRAAQVAQAAHWAPEAKAEVITPKCGNVVVITRGRTVPIGTVGKVFWARDGRVGIALDNTKDATGRHAHVAWVDADNIQAV